MVVVGQLKNPGELRERRAVRLIGGAFIALAIYVAGQVVYTLLAANHPHRSTPGIVWTAATALVMLALAAGKARTGKALANRVLQAEARVTHRRLPRSRGPARARAQRGGWVVVG